MRSIVCLVLCVLCSAAVAGEERSVLVTTPATAPAAPVAVVAQESRCLGVACRLYNERVTEEDSCRRTLRGGYVKRQVVRKVYTPVR